MVQDEQSCSAFTQSDRGVDHRTPGLQLKCRLEQLATRRKKSSMLLAPQAVQQADFSHRR